MRAGQEAQGGGKKSHRTELLPPLFEGRAWSFLSERRCPSGEGEEVWGRLFPYSRD